MPFFSEGPSEARQQCCWVMLALKKHWPSGSLQKCGEPEKKINLGSMFPFLSVAGLAAKARDPDRVAQVGGDLHLHLPLPPGPGRLRQHPPLLLL